MIDQSNETVISLSEAAKLIPPVRAGKHLHPSCLYRWTSTGCRGVLLDVIVIGGTRMTSREALDRFFSALTARAVRGPAVAIAPRAATRNPRHEAADQRLAAKGL